MNTGDGGRLEEQIARLRDRLEYAAEDLARLEKRLQAIENGPLFRFTRGIGLFALYRKRQVGQWLLNSRFHAAYLALRRPSPAPGAYAAWAARREAALPSLEWHQQKAAQWTRHPRVSILMPIWNPQREWLQAAIASVIDQSYPHWELCICDDASAEPWVRDYLEGCAALDSRIRFRRNLERGGISNALNAAGALASGDYVIFLDHDDVLHRYALHYVAEAAQEPGVAVIYSDEQRVDESGRPLSPILKPDWSPDLLFSHMYFGHLFALSKEAIGRAGWFDSAYDGAQDYDLALRATAGQVRVVHIPQILYNWREHAGSTARSAAAKPATHEAGRRALQAALRTEGTAGSIEDGPYPNTYAIRRKLTGKPLVTIVICSRNPKLLARCLRALDRRTAYRNYEVLVVRHETIPNPSFDAVLKRYGAAGILYSGPFHFARMNNLAARSAPGDILLFLNDDVQPLESSWLERLAGHVQRPEVGTAGAKLIYPAGVIQHAGIVIGMGDGAGHAGRGLFQSEKWMSLDLTRNVSAVTGACLAIRKGVFDELTGFDDAFPANYNDVDLCLRVRRAGYLVVYEPRAILRHDECQTRVGGTSFRERERFRSRWGAVLRAPDPYYPAAFDRTNEIVRLADPPGAEAS